MQDKLGRKYMQNNSKHICLYIILRDTYKVIANITFWVIMFFVAKLVIRIIPRHRKLQKKKKTIKRYSNIQTWKKLSQEKVTSINLTK